MAVRALLDSDVLIDFLRGRPDAVAFLSNLQARPLVSVVTVAELFAGVREGSERASLETFLRSSVTVEVDEGMATRAGLLLPQYRKSHGMGLADALIAAAAEVSGASLVTLNAKHFPMLTNIVVPYTK
ncbi:MAG TPA: type II toxin-antitoxin system VapC family toxin [Tepidisphaeraceae bacterium]|nr:type II toxin-antitoxin system VapC family toxin [Tepidisphaeraceae bacterium]